MPSSGQKVRILYVPQQYRENFKRDDEGFFIRETEGGIKERFFLVNIHDQVYPLREYEFEIVEEKNHEQ